jgi:biotin synthase
MEKGEILFYLNNPEKFEIVRQLADKIRMEYCGDSVHLRGIIEFSNYCHNNCCYCGLKRDNKNIIRYRMSVEEVINRAVEIASLGIKTVVLQSGDDLNYSCCDICDIVNKIKEKTDMAITLSIGERENSEYKAFKDAGADRYLLRFETSNEHYYKVLHPGQTLKRRLEILDILRKFDYQVGTGFIIGLPEETDNDLCNNIILLKDISPDMIGLGPFVSQSDTPYNNYPNGDITKTLTVLALVRITTKNTHIPATTAIGTIDKDGLFKALNSGANVIMPDFTPMIYKENYNIYDNKVSISIDMAKDVVKNAGRYISSSRGDTLKRGY